MNIHTHTETHSAGVKTTPSRRTLPPYFWAECSCGFMSEKYSTWDEAFAVADAHLEGPDVIDAPNVPVGWRRT